MVYLLILKQKSATFLGQLAFHLNILSVSSSIDELNAAGFTEGSNSEGGGGGGDTGGQGVFVIGATSRLEAIDPALRTGRRLGREIAMGIPDEKARRKILEVSCDD